MGTYDELKIDDVVWQTKALGKRMRTYEPGEAVEVERVAGTDDPDDVEAHVYDDLPRRYVVEIRAVEYALVDDGRLVGLATEADRDKLTADTFDFHGRDVHDDLTHDSGVFDPQRPARTVHPKQPPLGPRPHRTDNGVDD